MVDSTQMDVEKHFFEEVQEWLRTQPPLKEGVRVADESRRKLVRWLMGKDTPLIGLDRDPHEWLVLALECTHGEKPELASAMAMILAQCLENGQEVMHEPLAALFARESLRLAPQLCKPAILGEPVRAFVAAIAPLAREDNRLHTAGLQALIATQTDDSLESFWLHRLAGVDIKDGLSPAPLSDIFGLIQMPETIGGNEPKWDALGVGLKLLAEHLVNHPTPKGGMKFRHVLRNVFFKWGEQPDFSKSAFHWKLLTTAVKNKWPEWAICALPCLRFQPPDRSNENIWIVWRPIFDLLWFDSAETVDDPSLTSDAPVVRVRQKNNLDEGVAYCTGYAERYRKAFDFVSQVPIGEVTSYLMDQFEATRSARNEIDEMMHQFTHGGRKAQLLKKLHVKLRTVARVALAEDDQKSPIRKVYDSKQGERQNPNGVNACDASRPLPRSK